MLLDRCIEILGVQSYLQVFVRAGWRVSISQLVVPGTLRLLCVRKVPHLKHLTISHRRFLIKLTGTRIVMRIDLGQGGVLARGRVHFL